LFGQPREEWSRLLQTGGSEGSRCRSIVASIGDSSRAAPWALPAGWPLAGTGKGAAVWKSVQTAPPAAMIRGAGQRASHQSRASPFAVLTALGVCGRGSRHLRHAALLVALISNCMLHAVELTSDPTLPVECCCQCNWRGAFEERHPRGQTWHSGTAAADGPQPDANSNSSSPSESDNVRTWQTPRQDRQEPRTLPERPRQRQQRH